MWLQEFKIALIEKDAQKLEELAGANLQFDTVEEMQEAMYLMKQAQELLNKLKDDTALSMQQLQQNIDFLKETQVPVANKLDIIS
jgi:hypothetical protein